MRTSNDSGRRFPLWLIVLLFLVVAYGIFRYIGFMRLDEVRTTLQDKGYPVTLEELDTGYAEPAHGENAAEVLAVAFERMQGVTPGESELIPYEGEAELAPIDPPAPEMMAAMKAYLGRNTEALELLREGAALPESRWPVNLLRAFDVQLPHLAQLRQGARVLMADAVYRSESGDVDGAIDDVVAACGLSRSLDDEPILISQLVRIAIGEIAFNGVERLLSRFELSAEQIRRLDGAVKQLPAPEAFTCAMVGEACLSTSASGPYGNGAMTLAGAVTGLSEYDPAALFGKMNSLDEAYALDLTRRGAAVREWQEDAEDVPPVLIYTAILLPGLARAPEAQLRLTGRVHVARTALAAELYRLENGTYPESLDALVPEFLPDAPLDPFTGVPIDYEKDLAGYSVHAFDAFDPAGSPAADEPAAAQGVRFDIPANREGGKVRSSVGEESP